MHANTLLAFVSALSVANAAAAVDQSNGFTNIGCFNETLQVTGRRALTGNARQRFNNDMTVDRCTQLCQGSKYSGLEFKRECFCGNDLAAQAVAISSSRCQETCSGNNGQYCGGNYAISLYQNTSTISGGNRALGQTSSAWTLLPSQPLIFGSLAAISFAVAAVL